MIKGLKIKNKQTQDEIMTRISYLTELIEFKIQNGIIHPPITNTFLSMENCVTKYDKRPCLSLNP